MDLYDMATEREESDRERAIALARSKNQSLKFTGHCLYCNEQLALGRFCPGEDCGEQWEFEQKVKRIKGF